MRGWTVPGDDTEDGNVTRIANPQRLVRAISGLATVHAQFLTNKIVALDGEPATTPRPVPAAKTNQAMLESVLAAEKQAGKDYPQRTQEAEEYGGKGLVVQLEDMVRDGTDFTRLAALRRLTLVYCK